MEKKTIVSAATEVLNNKKAPMSLSEIFTEINNKKLFAFKTKQAEGVLGSALRKHTEGVNLAKSSSIKYFGITPDRKYYLLKK